MDPTIVIFLASGLFLGWSLGANDAANVFGTAVGSRMLRFGTAAVICAAFVIAGAVVSGEGPAQGLGRLGSVNALAGSFTVALSAGITVYAMTKLGLPVSTTQAIVGAIVGWNFFSGSITDVTAVVRIVGTWVACPILGALFAVVLYRIVVVGIRIVKPHMLQLDVVTRVGLVLAGAFGAYTLGANNIANVMGVFVPSSPFHDLQVVGVFTLTSVQQLFLIGGLAIAVGVFYSRRVMMTVGTSILPVSPVGAWVVVVAHSLVLFVFSSRWLQQLVMDLGLPEIPLVPVSSSQAVVGAVIGLGLSRGLKTARQIHWSALAGIGWGWLSTPVVSSVICFFLLFFMQNVFQQRVYDPVELTASTALIERLRGEGIEVDGGDFEGRWFENALRFRTALRRQVRLSGDEEARVIRLARIEVVVVDGERLAILDDGDLLAEQIEAVRRLTGRAFTHRWQFEAALASESETWRRPAAGGESQTLFDRRLESLRRALRPPDQGAFRR